MSFSSDETTSERHMLDGWDLYFSAGETVQFSRLLSQS